MRPEERADYLASVKSSKFLKGAERPPFPNTVDNTMRTAYRKCAQSFFREHLLCRVMGADNIHLVAGAAFADGMDAFRKSYFDKDSEGYKDYELALERGIFSIIKSYGFDESRDSSPDWAGSPKSCDRLLAAFLSYWEEFHPRASVGKMYYFDGQPASELGTTIELDVNHPETGEPLLYSVRFDYVEERNGAIWLGDDKTTSSLGASWARQWDLRAQFMGYTYAARNKLGIPAKGVIARGTGILKTDIKHMEVPVSFTPELLDRWWEQINKDFSRMVDDWETGDFDYDFADGCAAYGGCKFIESCRSKFQGRALDMMPIRVWNPLEPENSPVRFVEDL